MRMEINMQWIIFRKNHVVVLVSLTSNKLLNGSNLINEGIKKKKA